MAEIFMMRDILRIMTPAEINDLTTTSDGENRVSLTFILDDEIDRNELFDQGLGQDADKILLFKKKRDFRAGMSSKRLFKFIGLTNDEDVTIEKAEREAKSRKRGKKLERSNHFLDARDGLKESQRKLKSAEVLQLYKKSSEINSEQIKNAKDDLSKSNNLGILINKKQA